MHISTWDKTALAPSCKNIFCKDNKKWTCLHIILFSERSSRIHVVCHHQEVGKPNSLPNQNIFGCLEILVERRNKKFINKY